VRRLRRIVGTVLVGLALVLLAWTVVVWAWRDPVTSLYASYEQHRLASRLDERAREFEASAPPARPRPAAPAPTSAPAAPAARDTRSLRTELAADARRFRLRSKAGDPIGRLYVPRLGLKTVVVDSTTTDSLRKGPGRYLGSYMPGEGRLVYIAGHRTTYLAPFSHIEKLRVGDPIMLKMPYGVFRYRVTGHQIVAADDLSVLRSGNRERLALQACHPRFFATHRYIVWARLVRETGVGKDSGADAVAAGRAAGSAKDSG
jgi:sortase A